jgi:copper chaperone
MTKVVEFKVGMTCSGCSGAITRILSKIEGVESIDANVEAKSVKVSVDDALSEETLLEALMKWSKSSGKSVELIQTT